MLSYTILDFVLRLDEFGSPNLTEFIWQLY